MKIVKFAWAAALGLSLSLPAMSDELTGDVRLSCEAILCLSTGKPPSECTPSLRRYFSIDYTDPSKTIRKRIDFLNLCPTASQDDNMRTLVDALANGAGRCDVASLNAHQMFVASSADGMPIIINDQMPTYCTAYLTNPNTDLKATMPVYVGTPRSGGFWTTPADYTAALAKYNATVAARGKLNSFDNAAYQP
jgi:hypothetical protein